jgi:trehalose 6-phosphate synthase
MNRLVVVSNRVPDPSAAGSQAGGLAVALNALMEKRGGIWFGWSGTVSSTVSNAPARVVTRGKVDFATIDLTREEHDRYYSNHANGVLWPLLHTMPGLMSFDRRDAQVYRDVNARFADALVPFLRPHDLVWVHDYHLLALPALLRARHVWNPVGFFLHIPFPAPEVLAAAPEAPSLIRDLLAADLIGFQTDQDLQNFAAAAKALAGAIAVSQDSLQAEGHRIRLGVFPVEIDGREFAEMAAASAETPSIDALRTSLNGRKLVVGVDRLDPTKGLLQRLAGYRRLLETRREWRARVTWLQIAAVSRKEVAAYRELRLALEREAGAMNSEFGEPDWTPLRLIARAGERPAVAGFMREARVGLVTPLRDGMNLVAKEYVAAQDPDDPGVLVLSRFAGAARQLDSSVLVNPHDPDDMADGLDTALRMPLSERRDRWQSAWRAIGDASPLVWGRSFLATLLRAALVAQAPTIRPKLRSELRADALPLLAGQTVSPGVPIPPQVN